MERESSNEKCDRILIYLNNKPIPYKQTLSWDTFTKEIGIGKSDESIGFLAEKGYINQTFSDISISDSGRDFIANYTFHQKRIEEETKSSLDWYNQQDAKQRFEDYSTLKRQRKVAYIISGVMLLIAIVSLIVAIQQYLKCK